MLNSTSSPMHSRTADEKAVALAFDALRMANGPQELGAGTPEGVQTADSDEPFYVLLEDDRLITKVSVTTDTLLEAIPEVKDQNNAVRLVISVTVRPYHVHMDNLAFS